jgi:hypothetical protein
MVNVRMRQDKGINLARVKSDCGVYLVESIAVPLEEPGIKQHL